MDDSVLTYIVNHVFMPPVLPQQDDRDISNDAALCDAVLECARCYRAYLQNDVHKLQKWNIIIDMLQNFKATLTATLGSAEVERQLSSMNIGDILVYHINAQNACVVFRRQPEEVIYEAFEVMFPNEKVMGAIGKLISSFPGPAIAFPSATFRTPAFRKELASFLVEMHNDFLEEASPTSRKAGHNVIEEREPAHPRFITQLLTGILYGQGGRAADVKRFSKRINDDVLWLNAKLPWRRSPIWLVLRVALQSSLFEGVDHTDYKFFLTYFIASILDKARQKRWNSDLIDVMKKKMCRRLAKLSSSAPVFLTEKVHSVGKEVNAVIEERGRDLEIQQQKSSYWNPSELNIAADTTITLPNSSAYIEEVLRRAPSPQPTSPFSPNHVSRLRDNPDFSSLTKDRLTMAFREDKFIALADFEYCVENHLDAWLSGVLHESATSGILSVCLFEYMKEAENAYLSNAEDESLMLLTIIGLWVALDKVAVAQYPLLHDYSPEVPIDLLKPLLLRHSKSLKRMVLITQYIRDRHYSAMCRESLFDETASHGSFAVRYFDSSTELQHLKQRIEHDAALERARKVEELQRANDHYHAVKAEAQHLEHEYTMRWQRRHGDYRRVHDKACRKCRLDKQYTSMTIAVHEHPLPDNVEMAKMVVFEVKCPIVIEHWRVATYTILHDLCTPSSAHNTSSASPPMTLASYSPLQRYISRDLGRVMIASSTKSFLQAHYKEQKVPTTEVQVCLCSGLKYELYDSKNDIWISNPFINCDIHDQCTLRFMPDGIYDNLTHAVRNTSHTSNEMIANQSDCLTGLTLHEYAAFTGLRMGERLQWLNIVRELRARMLTFNHEAVHTLLTQSVCQVGVVAENGDLEWHIDLYDLSFRQVLLRELWNLLLSVEGNWLEGVTLRSIILLTSRLLVTTTLTEHLHFMVNNNTDSCSAYDILRKARITVFLWVQMLVDELQKTVKENVMQDLQCHIFKLATTIQATYDVEPEHLPALLQSDEDIRILVESTIIMHDNTPVKQAFISPEIWRLLRRSERLAHFIEPYMWDMKLNSAYQQGVNLAVTSIWPAYHATHWTVLDSPNHRWISTSTAVDADQQSQQVHLNLLTGLLLISGKPLSRLPWNITSHATYGRIFGTKILDVIPSDRPGIEYASHCLISGWQIYLGLKNDTLIIQAKKDDIVFELIPHTTFECDLPQLFVKEYTHWINLNTSEVELRPLVSLWKPSQQNWRMICNASKWKMSLDDHEMIDLHSQTFNMVSACLQIFEQCHYIHITYAPSDTSLHIDLPRFQLSFFLNKDAKLECYNFPNMLIDENQSAGSLLGLESRLVLCSKHSLKLPQCRHILIPFGEVQVVQQKDHVQIVIQTGSARSVKFYDYTIDSNIGHLVSSPDLTSNLYQVFLHALSSHSLPDPLTGQTGTEEAIHLLQSAICYSFQNISNTDLKLLHNISSLTPHHTWYPKHKKSMQSIQWHYHYCSSQGQHHAFHKLVGAIIDYARLIKVFSISSNCTLDFNSNATSSHLLHRSSFRLSHLYPADFSLFNHQEKDYDNAYHSHDQEQDINGIAANTSQMIKHESFCRIPGFSLTEKLSDWGSIGPADVDFSLSYKRLWLSSKHLQRNWLSFLLLNCNSLSAATRQWQALFSMSAMAYNDSSIQTMIPSLLALTVCSWQHISGNLNLLWCSTNSHRSFDLSIRDTPEERKLAEMVSNARVSLDDSPVASMVQLDLESYSSFLHRKKAAYDSLDSEQAPAVCRQLFASWSPETEPAPIHRSQFTQFSSMFKIDMLLDTVMSYFQHCFHNGQLRHVTDTVQGAVASILTTHPQMTQYNFMACSTRSKSRSIATTLKQLLVSRNTVCIAAAHDVTTMFWPIEHDLPTSSPSGMGNVSDTGLLASLIFKFKNSNSKLKQLYGAELDESLQHLVSVASPSDNALPSIPVSVMENYRFTCQEVLTCVLAQITALLQASNSHESALQLGGLWPCINTRSILCQITQDIGIEWKSMIEKFALLFIQHQRAQRLLLSVVNENSIEFYREMSNGRVTAICPEWLLLQVDNNFISRSIQTSVAHEIISPSSKENSVLQLNMGEGKSSVIVPMTAVVAADGHSIVRVVVLKSLARQMFQLLVQRISGLTNRRVFYMPFSRRLAMGSKEIEAIWKLYRQCMDDGGVLVIQPEHILSFKLMCVNRLLDGNGGDGIGRDVEAAQLLELQKWLDGHVKDILDESDEILHVRYQLIYTVGTQRSLEGHPERWTTIQQIFTLVTDVISSVESKAPRSVEIRLSEKQDGTFPFIFLYSNDDKIDPGIELVDSVCTQILNGRLDNYPIFARLSDDLRQQVRHFISEVTVKSDVARSIQDLYLGTDAWNLLLLLRGLFAHGILVYVLKARRYRVDYGLDLSRTLLAVPYRAKDVPSLAAEFGHPDVAITLTCLSYYYAGLTEEQVDICFELLFKEDDPNIEYCSWIKGNEKVPSQLLHIAGINLKDMEQRSQYLIPLFHRHRAVVDFFLSHVVFPKHAKEFPQKISTSGWDLAARRSKHTTGFSGTNDNHHLLPLSIQQYDPVEQRSTNAKVLNCLLRPENDHYECICDPSTNSSLTTEKFLDLLVRQKPEIRVLLDVGAQMLELRNEQLAKAWLGLRPTSVLSAAIYFDDADELMVLNRQGVAEPLFLSPFKYQLDKCVVYLDEAHTRGTDLKLPVHFRAAVTLGVNVTKDRLVQGAMRMRQLGQGQSVMFFAPREIDQKIRKAAQKSDSAKIKAVDILRWSMLETCDEITRRVPQWAQQGYDYQRRKEAWEACISSDISPAVLNPWLQPEGRSLQELYGLSDGPAPGSAIWQVGDLRERCEMLGLSFVSETNMDEEQEREVSHEIERERHVERPAKASPARHSLHPDVRAFVWTGIVRNMSPAFKPLFRAFEGISSMLRNGENIWTPNLLCTEDFATTIRTSNHSNVSDYLRSINWVVSAKRNENTILVVFSPFEINELLPDIRTSTKVHLHIYSPKVSVSTKAFDDLQFHCIPGPSIQINDDLLIIQLNIFAGQLYMQDYDKYQQLCSFLGLYQGQQSANASVPMSDGFIKPEHRIHGDISPFKESPVPFLKALLGSRRKGHPYLATDLGKILHGHLLTAESFQTKDMYVRSTDKCILSMLTSLHRDARGL
ncbi:uncharacterized protein BT62DRAFT_884237 [Guyanagaster necrorhizus]|uniref:ubiquitinyl hydrolase 1 n=1 Tax=Guyanagaster necrorhizus TaxID=856835 RepID=A0A9P7W2E1_9AGAR|nr:uncharacterized protein BT62DRAFT_884237 [Guyanagaster necrorhizus MCA 3950]KAG7450735.1 hypothetical protein BT62DRAFT_884237 [Guyanagaster necrorhizus MCA 3950]